MNIKISKAGVFNFDMPQNVWHDEADKIMQTSKYAGHEMMVIQKSDDEPDVYELHYLGFEASGFISMSNAKCYASQFAFAVLNKLSELIIESANDELSNEFIEDNNLGIKQRKQRK